jgi:A/G-specific adenine glycosylase
VQELRPVRRAKTPAPHREMVAAAIERSGRYLFLKRRSNGLLGGLWELPAGEVERGEDRAHAVRRVLRDAFGLSAKIGGLVTSLNFAFSHFKVTLSVYRCDWRSGAPSSDDHCDAKWVAPSAFSRLAFPTSHRKFLHLL